MTWRATSAAVRHLTPSLPGLAAACYALGYLITLAYYARLSLPAPRLTDGRILASGVLFALHFATPAFFLGVAAAGVLRTTIVALRSVSTRRLKLRRLHLHRLARGFLLAGLSALLVPPIWRLATDVIAVDNWDLRRERLFSEVFEVYAPHAFYASAALWAASALLLGSRHFGRTRGRTPAAGAMAALGITVVISAELFAFSLFPRIRPEFGGGAAMSASLLLASDYGMLLTRHYGLRGTVDSIVGGRIVAGAVVNQDESTLTLILCGRRWPLGFGANVVTIPRDRIDLVTISGRLEDPVASMVECEGRVQPLIPSTR